MSDGATAARDAATRCEGGLPAAIASIDPDTLFAPLRSSRGLLLAVSGGPDSVALLLLMDRWRTSTEIAVTVATVDHRLREGSDREAAAVAELSRAHGLAHHTLVREGPPFRTRIQERARDARYDLLAAHATRHGADTIVTGHHADDQAETILMRLLRGSGPAGLAGMAAMSRRGAVTIARPLLGVPKSALLAVCEDEGVPFADDPSNRSRAFRRTALRSLAPTLASEGLDVASLVRLGRRATRAESALSWADSIARDRLGAYRDACATRVNAGAFAMLPEELALRFLAAELSVWSPTGPARLERVERLVTELRRAILDGTPYAATLAGCGVRYHAKDVRISLAPPRRSKSTPPKGVDAEPG